MSKQDYREKIVDEVTSKVSQRASTHAEEAEIRERAESAVSDLLDARVQSFVPLLAENEVLSTLMRERRAGQ